MGNTLKKKRGTDKMSIKPGDIVVVKDASWACGIKDGELQSVNGVYPTKKRYKVLAVDCILPINIEWEKYTTEKPHTLQTVIGDQENDAILMGVTDPDEVLFTQFKYLEKVEPPVEYANSLDLEGLTLIIRTSKIYKLDVKDGRIVGIHWR